MYNKAYYSFALDTFALELDVKAPTIFILADFKDANHKQAI